ncbi:MAG TPA: rod shape-determining protein MreC [Gemmatimonadaceae bacterium]|jgi:rod shape-determining protein MreC|nr:rod shape-determining protein MreC [Gemmatimonadota bacterium]MBK8645643.1 rod shape-determining protein MreC [Gemmatimonadota bacterium]HNV76997.1 rod shape-determining protein MreC [Gemmatimonadaceae bacterium]HPV76115.1 rod shape-determining protein MreC [Gemmatimonadaceae bacterium]
MARAARSGSRADTALVATCALLALLATVLPLPIRDAIASSLRRTLVAPLLALQERAERARTAFAERDAVAARLDSLVLRNAELGKMAQENVQLRGLLSLARQLQWGFVPAEALHGQGLGDEHVLLLTKGENAGVRMRSGVVAPDGLVGQVTTVDPRSSLAILWTHPDFRASAMSADGSAFGIVRPHLGEESGRSLLELRGVAFRDALEPGTLITTSGLGGVYPRGIPIGIVLKDIKTNEVWSRAYLLRPAVYPPDVSNVMILSPQRVAEGAMDSVWIDVSRAEGAARRLAASGDSLARLQAAASAFQQRQMDSLKAVLGIPTAGDSAASDSLAPRPDTLAARGDSVRATGRPAAGGAGTAAGRVPRRDSTLRRR